jgi:eukaryotic-like serine/threonine-protein kinase
MSTTCPSCRAENDAGADACFTCGMNLYSLFKGAVVASRYEILSPLGKGGMGVVYKAHDRELDEAVALKVLRVDPGGSQEMAHRFRSEIKLARKVRHLNVCAIHEYGQHGPMLFIAMELIDGMDLKQLLLKRGPLPPADAYQLAAQIADGLQAIHDEGIIHRDLKTTNVMLDERGVVRLMDFGIAKQAQAGTGLTATGQVVGTPEYMSPEQIRGQTLDFRSDLYSLGIVVFELFTGHVPFRGDTPAATILKHLEETPPLEGPAANRLPSDVVPLLRKALAKDPADRFPKAKVMAQALRKAGARHRSLSTEVPTPTATIGLAAPERSARRRVVGSVAAALVVAGALLYRWQSESERSPPPTVSAPASIGARPAEAPTPSTMLPAGAAPSEAAAPAVTPVETPAPGAAALKAAQVAITRGDYDVAVRQAQAAVDESASGDAQKVLDRARAAQRATVHVREAEAALVRGDLGKATEETALARAEASWEPALAGLDSRILELQAKGQRETAARVDDLLDRAEKALESRKADDAIALYDEALKLDRQNSVARMGRLTALNNRAAAQAAPLPITPVRGFVAGKTLAQSVETKTADAAPPGFDPGSGIAVARSTQAAGLPGLILFEAEPEAVRPGEKYTIKVLFMNGGTAPIEIRTMSVATLLDGGRSGGPVSPLTKVVAPREKALLLSPQGVWKDDVKSWSMEVAVYTAAGESYRNALTWR